MHVLGSVPYLNARPLVRRFEVEDLGVRVRYDLPSRLPALLDSGEAHAIMVSSVEALRTPRRRLADGVCIGSDGPVKSVRLFSKAPFTEIGTLALDASSMTSNRLAQVLLAELHGVRPATAPHGPDQKAMLGQADACVLIGDAGMRASAEGLHVMDLGEAWTVLTGLPFVWAAWIGGDGLGPKLAEELREAAHWSGCGRERPAPTRCGPVGARTATPSESGRFARREALLREVAAEGEWAEPLAREYLTEVMVYTMDDRAKDGLREFQRRLLAHGFDDCRHFPTIV